MIMICYDGSADAKAAVEHAAELFANEPATVLTVWEPFVEVIARTTVGFGMVPSIPDADEIDNASRKSAEQAAAEGVPRPDRRQVAAARERLPRGDPARRPHRGGRPVA
jgi:hypothetical protein